MCGGNGVCEGWEVGRGGLGEDWLEEEEVDARLRD